MRRRRAPREQQAVQADAEPKSEANKDEISTWQLYWGLYSRVARMIGRQHRPRAVAIAVANLLLCDPHSSHNKSLNILHSSSVALMAEPVLFGRVIDALPTIGASHDAWSVHPRIIRR